MMTIFHRIFASVSFCSYHFGWRNHDTTCRKCIIICLPVLAHLRPDWKRGEIGEGGVYLIYGLFSSKRNCRSEKDPTRQWIYNNIVGSRNWVNIMLLYIWQPSSFCIYMGGYCSLSGPLSWNATSIYLKGT